jgi:hypothetical protein
MLGPAKAGTSELSPSKTDNLMSFDQFNEQGGEYTNVKAKDIFETLYATWQPCKDGYTSRKQEREQLERDMPNRTYEETKNWLLNQRLTPEERNAYETSRELQKERENLENYYLDFKARGIKEGYYGLCRQHLPEFLKSKRQKEHEKEKADLFRRHDELKGREDVNLAACENHEAKLNDPEFKKTVDRAYAEITMDKRISGERLKVLDGELGILKQRLVEMSKLSKYLPQSISDKKLLIRGDPKDIDNVLSQSKEIRAQTAYAVLEKQPDYNFETGRPHEKEYQQQMQRGMERSM